MRYLVYVLLCFYTIYVGYHLVEINILRSLAELPFSDLFIVLYPLLTFLSLYTVSRFRKKLRPKISEISIVLLILVSIAYIFVAVSLYDDQNKAPMAVLVVGFFTTIGWIFTSNETRINSKKAHTLTILLQMRNSSDFNKNREILLDYLNEFSSVGNNEIDNTQLKIDSSGQKINISRSVTYVLNYYEYVCAGYLTRDLDESILIRTHAGIIIKIYDWFEPYIKEERNKSKPPNFRLYLNLEETVHEMKRKRKKEGSSLLSRFVKI